MLKFHPILGERESYKVRYLNVLEYFVRKYSASDLWATQTLKLYIKKILKDEKFYSYSKFDLRYDIKWVIATKFRPYKFFSYR